MKLKQSLLTLLMIASATLLQARGNKEAPDVQTSEGHSILSPNGDGIQDEITIRFSLKLFLKSDQGYLPELRMEILSDEGLAVREELFTEESDISRFRAAFRKWQDFELSREVNWDGMDNEGKPVPDGEYSARFTVTDSAGNTTDFIADRFRVDSTPPAVELNYLRDRILSPNGDEKKDLLVIRQQGSKETLWRAEIRDNREFPVRHQNYENSEPAHFTWDGRDDLGELLPDGFYSYHIFCTDEGGNRTEEVIRGIELNTVATEISGSLDSTSLFIEGKPNQITATLDVTTLSGLEEWHYSLRRSDTLNYLFITGSSAEIPQTIIIDGRDLSGDVAEEGFYDLIVSAKYRNGNEPSFHSQIYIDTSAAEIEITMPQWPVISPNDDGIFDIIEIPQKGTKESVWNFEVINSENTPVYSRQVLDSEPEDFVWDGKNNTGTVVPDGLYLYKVTGQNAAEDISLTEEAGAIRVSSYTTGIKAHYPSNTFSPNGDSEHDSILVELEHERLENAVAWEWVLESQETGQEVNRISGDSSLPKSILMDGTDNNGRRLREGIYRLSYLVQYDNGNQPMLQEDFYIDLTPPHIKMETIADPFARTTEGALKGGNLYITLDIEDQNEIVEWELDIRDREGQIVRSFAGEGSPASKIAWNGQSDLGELLNATADYTIDLKVVDSAGNSSRFDRDILLDILVVEKNGRFYLMVPNLIFSAYKSELDSAGSGQLAANIKSLEKLKSIFEKYPDYRLLLEGHALNIFEPQSGQWLEEEERLKPLTQERAQRAMEKLIELGFDKSRISTEAYGGVSPIVSTKERKIRWKNRRVEFVMIPPPGRKPSKQR